MVFISDFFTALQYSVRSSLILRNQSHRSSKQTYVAFALAGSFRGDLIRPPSPVWRHHVDISPMASAQADPRWEVIASQGCLSHSVSAVFNPLQCSALSNDCSEFWFRDEAGSEERGSRVFFFFLVISALPKYLVPDPFQFRFLLCHSVLILQQRPRLYPLIQKKDHAKSPKCLWLIPCKPCIAWQAPTHLSTFGKVSQSPWGLQRGLSESSLTDQQLQGLTTSRAVCVKHSSSNTGN